MKRYFWLVVPVILALGFVLVFARAAAQSGDAQQPQTMIRPGFYLPGVLE